MPSRARRGVPAQHSSQNEVYATRQEAAHKAPPQLFSVAASFSWPEGNAGLAWTAHTALQKPPSAHGASPPAHNAS